MTLLQRIRELLAPDPRPELPPMSEFLHLEGDGWEVKVHDSRGRITIELEAPDPGPSARHRIAANAALTRFRSLEAEALDLLRKGEYVGAHQSPKAVLFFVGTEEQSLNGDVAIVFSGSLDSLAYSVRFDRWRASVVEPFD